MSILLHTIALEPARWTARRVSQRLTDLVPKMAAAGFWQIEIFEPHLAAESARDILGRLSAHEVEPVVLSSYLDLAQLAEEAVAPAIASVRARMDEFGFRKIRLFPGPKIAPDDGERVALFTKRLFRLAECLAPREVLLETHDGSIADDPAALLKIIDFYPGTNVGLLYQPTVFRAEEAWAQFKQQQAQVRHLHLQDRDAGRKVVFPGEGVLPWPRMLEAFAGDVTIEFLPGGMKSEESFNLDETLQEACRAREFVEAARRAGAGSP